MTKTPAKPDKAEKKQDTRFKPGQSGNPKGCPKGSRHRVTRAIEALLDGEAEKLTRKAIEKALEGDNMALRLCLERLCPPPKDRHVTFELPAMQTTSDMVKAVGALLTAVANGELTPSEAQTVAAIVETQRRTLESEEIERLVAELEARKGINN